MRFRKLFLLIIGALALDACDQAAATAPDTTAPSGSLHVIDVWSRPVIAMNKGPMSDGSTRIGDMGGATGVVYLTIQNSGTTPDRLLKVESPDASSAELHQEVNDNGVMSMRPLDGVDIPAGGEVTLKPGHMHVMLIGLKHDLKPGDMFAVTLHFTKAGAVTVQVGVRQR
jgi:copper(I)-binding protein